MKQKALQEMLKRAIAEMRETLDEEGEAVEDWDPDAWEEEVRQFTQQLGQQLLQVWAEVRTEQAQAQAPFALIVAEGVSCTDGSPCGG
jgi:DNA-binding GntR family transcriptional regulator